MAVVSTPAIVLHAFPYGESSKIVRLATPGHGVLSAIAKGAQRTKSKFGARLQPMSDGIAQLYIKPSRELQTLAEFDVERERLALSHDLARYASASAVAELVMRFSPAEPHPEIYALLASQLDRLADADAARLPSVSLEALWRVVGALGFTPALDHCAVDGNPIPAGAADFSVVDGGLVCAPCAGSRETARLGTEDRMALESFVREDGHDSGLETVSLSPRHSAAHRRLLSRFVRLHVSEGRELKALDFWESLPWRDTS
jgi:DNA repair protein RecO (recombination protein O)